MNVQRTWPVEKPTALNPLNRIARYRGAIELGWYDFITRFRRAYFGPLWITFQLGIWVGTLSLVLADALGDNFGSYIVYLAIGFFTWEYISGVVGDAPVNFTSRDVLLKNIPIRLSYLTIRKLSYLFSRSLFQLPVPALVVLFYGNIENPLLILVLIPLLFFLACFGYGCLVIMGVIGALYRDIAFLNTSILRFLFFTSPVFWRGDEGIRKLISIYNPVAHFLNIARAPFEGYVPSMTAWLVVGGCSLFSLALAIWVQSTFRNRLIYWL
ncbi:MAG: ABC transporter permease [Pseudomonadota bacterium]